MTFVQHVILLAPLRLHWSTGWGNYIGRRLQLMGIQESPDLNDCSIVFIFSVVHWNVPYNVAGDHSKQPHYVCKEQDGTVGMLPRTRVQELKVFEFALSYAAKLFGKELVPMQYKATVSTLNMLGNTNSSWGGFNRRPRFPLSKQILDLLAGHLQNGYRDGTCHCACVSTCDSISSPRR